MQIANTNLDSFNKRIDEIVKNYFKGYRVEDAIRITKDNIAATIGDLSSQDKAEITYAALQKRKCARKRGNKHFRK